MTPYRVLYITHYTQIGGAETSLLLLLEHLDRGLFQPLVALPCGGPLADRCRSLGVEPIILPLQKLHRSRPVTSPLGYARGVVLLARLMAASRVHLVHVGLEWSAQYGVVAARLARRPVVCHVRDLLSYKAFRREFVPLSSRVIANSRAVADVVSSYNFPRERIHTIHNGVDLSWFSPDPVRREAFRRKLGIAEGEWAVGLLAARIDALKGQVEFVRALRLSKDRGTSVRGIVTGRNPPESRMDHLGRLKQLVAKLQLDGNVVFTGFVDDMRGLYDALDLVVVASKAEPFGRTIIEAMAMGKPVVSTAAGGPLEILQDGATGLLVPPDDPSAVADAMVRLACDRRLAAQLGMAGRTRAEDSFCIERSVQATEGVYRSLLEIG